MVEDPPLMAALCGGGRHRRAIDVHARTGEGVSLYCALFPPPYVRES